jgi:two-component system response regulator (stage 0 sporulation protein F)
MGASPPHGETVRHIIVADEDPAVVAFILHLLREDGHAAFHAYDAMSATQLASALGDQCDLLISNTKVVGADGVELIRKLRGKWPRLPILYLANIGRSTPELEAKLPPDIPIIREPFTAEQLRAAIGPLLDGGRPRPLARVPLQSKPTL